ncbi:TetR/AcrR family transcriptional regulator [Jeongeupia naejangsanensis]|uniref:TetR/AcrR family transcriptional regulator n=1 Tax=Jeongeupia naejangsanensis TaxID=613195 RepID=A0ABS2BNH6_9NEIS|nr:TetR/AcrR family transcriptional regulator [Jeongeupia naejangsanensis]MBM3116995.1 TetR/AcrR family transcriptional regulator [Jeongeupia naejangsanensis]
MNTTAKPPRTIVDADTAAARILDAAETLFYREGSRNVGVDAVVKEAGVNKMSLYRQFSSKDELLRRYLQRRDDRFWGYVDASLELHPHDAAAALRQFFADLAERAGNPAYRGCPFVNIAVEYPEREHFARVFVADNKRQLLQKLTELATRAGARDPAALAKGLALLIEGAYAASQTYAPETELLSALPATADLLIAAAMLS